MEYFELAQRQVDLSQLRLNGRILDLGGGGEGVIARCAGEKVVAIDLSAEELQDAANAGMKIEMDACDLKFVGPNFDTVTSFYTLMYMTQESVEAAVAEAYRVLRPGGQLWIWDCILAEPGRQPVFVAQVSVTLPGGQVLTPGYGAAWQRAQTAEGVIACGEKAGFKRVSRTREPSGFTIVMQK